MEGDSIRLNVGFEDVLKFVKCDRSRAVTVGPLPVRPTVGEWGKQRIHVEILEGDVVIRVSPLQQRLEHHKIFP